MNKHRLFPKPRAAAALACSILGFTSVYAQPVTRSADAEPTSTTPITLEEFSVTAEKAGGYRAGTSITATGIGSKIIDTPIAISVVTEELTRDIAAFEIREALDMVPNVSTRANSESSIRVRGFSGNISYRNGQYRRQLLTTWNVDRTEVIKGPSSIFFGAVRPSGIVNMITAKPVLGQTFTDVSLTVGSYDFYKAAIYHNASLGPKLSMRVGVGAIDRGGDRQFEFLDEYYAGLSFVWEPTGRQRITVDLENINRKRFYLSAYGGSTVTNSRYLYNPAVPAANQRSQTAESNTRAWLNSNGFGSEATFDTYASIYGPDRNNGYGVAIAHDARNNHESRTVDIQYLAKISDSFVWQTDLNYSFDDAYGLQPATGQNNVYADGTQRFRVEEFINIRDTINIDNKLTWRFSVGSTKHTVQLGQEYQSVVFNRPGYFDSNSRYNNSPFGAYVYNYRPGVDAPVSLRAMMNESGQTFNIEFDRTENNEGYYLVNQMSMFEDRLHVLGGARYNRYRGDIEYSRPISNSSLSAASPGGLADRDRLATEGGWTPQIGGLFKITREVAAYATFSESIEPDFALDADGNANEAVESSGLDLGFKTTLLEGRIASTLSYYEITRGNIAYRDSAREAEVGRSPYFLFGNEEQGSGVEFDINWTVSDNYQLLFGWGHLIKAQQTRSGGFEIDGPRFAGLPKNVFNVWNRYTFGDGPLRGLNVGIGLRYSEEAAVSGSAQNVIVHDSFTKIDLMLSYPLRIFDRDVRVQFNAKNLTDRMYRADNDPFINDGRRLFFGVSTRF
jgi:iron complex outermembrane receptor protein